MTLDLVVLSNGLKSEQIWVRELEKILGGLPDLRILCSTHAHETPGHILFVDSKIRDLQETLTHIDRRGRAVFLILEDTPIIPEVLINGLVDDVLVYPFRSVEVIGKLHHYQQILMWNEVIKLNASFSGLVERLREDLRLAERLQKAKLPIRFSEVNGFRVSSRYLAGIRSGGDHFDLAESGKGSQLSIVLSDSSSYGLSSAVLSTLMRVAVKLSVDEARSSSDTVKRIYSDLAITLGEKDKLSLFYGVVNQKDFRLKYLNLGTSCAFFAPKDSGFSELPIQGGPITRTMGLKEAREGELAFSFQDRFALISDGFIEATGGASQTCELLNQFRNSDSADTLNELVFQVKSKFKNSDEMPAQDCTAIIFDADPKVIQFSKLKQDAS